MNKQKTPIKEMGLLMSNFQSSTYLFNKGIEAYRDKNVKKAKQYLERAVQLEPNEPGYLFQFGIILTDLGEFQRSNDCLFHILDQDLSDEWPECYFFIANNFANLGLFEHAKKNATKYLELDEDGEFLEDVEDLLEIISDDEEFINELFEDEEKFIMRYELAAKELELEHYDKATSILNNLIEEEPQFWAAYHLLSQTYYKNGKIKEAINLLESVLKKDSNNVVTRSLLMTYYYEVKEFAKAEQILQTLTNVSPMEKDQSYALAVAFGKVGKHELAYQGLERLQRFGYNDKVVFTYQLGVAAFYTGNLEKAALCWKKLSDLGNRQVLENLELLEQGKLTSPSYNYLS